MYTVYALNVNPSPSLGSGNSCYPHFTDVATGDHKVPWKEQQSWILSPHSPGPIFRRWLSGKELACHCRRSKFDPWVGKISWRRAWQPTPVFLPGESHGQRSLVGYTIHGSRKELDTTEWWRTHSTLLFSSTQVPISESLLPQWLWAARETPQTNHLPERRCKNLFPGLSPGISHKINASVGIRSSESDWGFWYFPKLRSNRRCWDNKFQGCRFSPSDNAWISCCLGHAPGNRQHLLPGTPISEIRCQVNPGPAQSISG